MLSHHIKYNLLHNLQRWGWVQSILYLSKEILTLLQQKLLPCVDFVPLDSCGTATVQSHREQRGVVCTNSAHAWSWWQSPWSRTLWDHSNTMATVLNTSCGTQNIVITKHRHWILAIWRLRHWYASKYWLQQPIYTKFQIIDYRFRVLHVFFQYKMHNWNLVRQHSLQMSTMITILRCLYVEISNIIAGEAMICIVTTVLFQNVPSRITSV